MHWLNSLFLIVRFNSVLTEPFQLEIFPLLILAGAISALKLFHHIMNALDGELLHIFNSHKYSFVYNLSFK